MNELRFLEVMGKIDDDLIKEAEIDIEQQYRIRHNRSRRKIYALISAAAAVVVTICSVAFFRAYNPKNIPGDNSSIIISDNNTVTTLNSQYAKTSVTTKLDQTTANSQSNVTSVISNASEVKASSTQTNTDLETTSLSYTAMATQNSHTQMDSAGRGTLTVSTATNITTTVSDQDFENEGSIIMKKYAAALAAFMAVSSSTPALPAKTAIYIPEISPTATSVKKFVDEYNIDLDLNSDGKVDIFDVYAMYRCEIGYLAAVPDYIKEKYDNMTKTKENDSEEVVVIEGIEFYQLPFLLNCSDFAKYFFTYYGLKPEYFDPNYYIDNCPDHYDDPIPLDVIKRAVKDIDVWNDVNLNKTWTYIKNDEGAYRLFTEDDLDLAYCYNEEENCYEIDNAFLFQYTDGSPIHIFIDDFKRHSLNDYNLNRNFMEMIQNSGFADSDINSDGVFDFDDIVLLAYYIDTYDHHEGNIDDPLYDENTLEPGSYYENYSAELRESSYNPITESEWNKARDYIDVLRYYFNDDYSIIRLISENYLAKNEVDQKYFDPVYYEKNHFAHYEYDENWLYPVNFNKTILFDSLAYFEEFSIRCGPGHDKYMDLLEQEERYDSYSDDEIKAAFPEYYKKVKTGVLPEPDLDLDGKIGLSDYIILDGIDWSHIGIVGYDAFDSFVRRYPEIQAELNISQEAIYNYKNNFDFNNNGISCDYFEKKCMRMYIFSELLSQYEDDDEALILALYYYEKEHPEMVYKRISPERMEEFIKNNGVGFTANTPEEEETEDIMETGETITSYSSYNQVHSSPETTKGLTGDVNGDGTVDLSDAVLIMQSLANPTKYGLNGSDDKHITEEGYLRADIDGEGVTNMDALTIQRYLLGLCSIEL